MPYLAFQAILDPAAHRGSRNYWRAEYLTAFPDEAIDTFVAHTRAPLSPFSQMVVFRIGQGIASADRDAAAIGNRDAAYLFHPISCWMEPADDDRLIAFTSEFTEAMAPFGTGAPYLNLTVESDRMREAHGAEAYDRLAALKVAYDPENVFRLNHNIEPRQPLAV
jgi:hypothetical protein